MLSSFEELIASEPITGKHFGVNHVFDFEEIGDVHGWQSADEVLELVSPGNIRFQGGSGAEKYFDIRNEAHFDSDDFLTTDSHGHNQIKILETVVVDGVTYVQKVTPLDKMMEFAAEQNASISIIVPMWNMLTSSESGQRDFDSGVWAEDLKLFIKNCLREAIEQGVSISAFELGNEYPGHVGPDGVVIRSMSAVEYGKVASASALIIQQAIDEFKFDEMLASVIEPQITLEVVGESSDAGPLFGKYFNMNEAVMGQFDQAELAALDAVTSHFYFREGKHSEQGDSYYHSYENIAGIVERISDLQRLWGDVDTGFSEWNLHFSPFDENNELNNYGLLQLPIILEMFSEFLINGADSLDFWSAQYKITSLAANNQDLSLVGELFAHMSENLIGTSVIELFPDTSGSLETHSFISDSKIFIYATSMSQAIEQLNLDLSIAEGGFDLVSVTSFTADASGGILPVISDVDIGTFRDAYEYDLDAGELLIFEFDIERNGGDEALYQKVVCRVGDIGEDPARDMFSSTVMNNDTYIVDAEEAGGNTELGDVFVFQDTSGLGREGGSTQFKGTRSYHDDYFEALSESERNQLKTDHERDYFFNGTDMLGDTSFESADFVF